MSLSLSLLLLENVLYIVELSQEQSKIINMKDLLSITQQYYLMTSMVLFLVLFPFLLDLSHQLYWNGFLGFRQMGL